MPAIRDGDHILVIDRKLFHDDNTRFFVGVVEEYDDRVIRLRGFPFHLSPYEVTGVATRARAFDVGRHTALHASA